MTYPTEGGRKHQKVFKIELLHLVLHTTNTPSRKFVYFAENLRWILFQNTLDEATDPWGVKVERVEVKDVRLPVQLQRVMAAEAEATREARAKVPLYILFIGVKLLSNE